jgi:hypothetical protein
MMIHLLIIPICAGGMGADGGSANFMWGGGDLGGLSDHMWSLKKV